MSPNLIKSIIRRVMPLVEAALVGVVAHFGWHPSTVVVGEIVAVVGTGLSIILPAAEAKFTWVGVFLGWIGAPAYAPSAKKLLTQTVATLQAELDALKGPISSATVADLAPVVPAETVTPA